MRPYQAIDIVEYGYTSRWSYKLHEEFLMTNPLFWRAYYDEDRDTFVVLDAVCRLLASSEPDSSLRQPIGSRGANHPGSGYA